MRAIPSSMHPAIVSAIDSRLRDVEADEQVRIPWAIESGSRAWGFPSPDSDYDCRFIYIRPQSTYLSLWPMRDVIETPLDPVLDVNGWDLAKTIRLMARGNATAGEWLRSPIVYGGDVGFRDRLLAFADAAGERSATGRHYSHVAQQQMAGPRNLKRFFYVLRPAAALRWLEVHPDAVVPPMDLPTLLEEGDPGRSVLSAAAQLIALKSETREMGSGRIPDVLRSFTSAQISRASVYENARPERDPEMVRAAADDLFASLL